jgi:hypothetical protein
VTRCRGSGHREAHEGYCLVAAGRRKVEWDLSPLEAATHQGLRGTLRPSTLTDWLAWMELMNVGILTDGLIETMPVEYSRIFFRIPGIIGFANETVDPQSANKVRVCVLIPGE